MGGVPGCRGLCPPTLLGPLVGVISLGVSMTSMASTGEE